MDMKIIALGLLGDSIPRGIDELNRHILNGAIYDVPEVMCRPRIYFSKC